MLWWSLQSSPAEDKLGSLPVTLNLTIPLNHYLLFSSLNNLRSSLKHPHLHTFEKTLVDANDFLRPQCELVTKSTRIHKLQIFWDLSTIIKTIILKICVYLGPQNLHLKCKNSSYLASPYIYLAVIQVRYCWKNSLLQADKTAQRISFTSWICLQVLESLNIL